MQFKNEWLGWDPTVIYIYHGIPNNNILGLYLGREYLLQDDLIHMKWGRDI